MEKLRIVLAGCGSMGDVWMKIVRDMADVEMVGFMDMNESAARSKAEIYGAPGALVSTDFEATLSQTSPDIVFDCTIPEAHHAITLATLQHGCHVLGEKPMADSMAHAREMVAAAQDAGKLYAVIQNRRYDPNIRRLRHFIDSGALGPLTTINCDFYIGAHFGGFRDHMEHVLLLDMAIHTFDAARYLSGTDPVSVYCKEWNPAGSWYDHDASAVAIFEMSNGLVYTYRGSWCSEGLHTTWESDWRIIGQHGSARWNGADSIQAQVVAETGSFLSKLNDVAIPPASTDAKIGSHAGQIRDFIDCVQNGRIPETICTDNIKSLAMVFAAIESAEKNQPVRVEISEN